MAQQEPGVIGRGISIRGHLSGSEPLVIEGMVEGTVTLDNHLTVEATGKVVADVQVQTLAVNGELNGNISAEQMVSVNASATVVGNIKAPRVVIEDGAVFRGSIDMDFELPEGAE